MLVAGAHAMYYQRREQERDASLARARLDALRMQLQPHFLFNSLNTIAGLIHQDPDKADALIGSLSDLLRRSLDSSNRQTTVLAHEIEFVRGYLELMHARFEERVRFRFEIAPEVNDALVPTMLLQPLAENAIEHGLRPKPGGGTVVIRAGQELGKLRLEVIDDGVGLSETHAVSENIGIGNTRARLAELHGDAATLTIRRDDGCTVVTVEIPFETRNP